MHCNRYALGVTIGSIYVLLSLMICGASVFSYLYSTKTEGGEYTEEFATEVVVSCLLVALISVLFIFAVLKKQQNFMLPWFLLCITEIVYSCFGLFILYFAASWANSGDDVICLTLLLGACIIGIEIAIFWFSCSLYQEIRQFNKEKSINVTVKYQNDSKNHYTHI